MKREAAKTISPVKPNAGVKAWYDRALAVSIARMAKATEQEVLAAYQQLGLAGDSASAPDQLASVVKRLAKAWQARFDKQALILSVVFSKRVLRHAEKQLQGKLRENGFTVKFKPTKRMREVIAATVQEQVSLIKSIPQQYMTDVQGLVMRSALKGRDVGGLAAELRKRYDMTKKRANTIARDQNNKATASMTQARQLALGITEGVWHHSHAGKTPRPLHVKANGKKFDLKKGMLIGGEYILPGEAINCRCTWSPVIPGFED